MAQAINFEIDRQIDLYNNGEAVTQETLGLGDEFERKNIFPAGKEEAQDYRYFPEPDIPPVHIDTWVEMISNKCPNCQTPKTNDLLINMD